MTHFKFCGPHDISGTVKARVVEFRTQVDYIKSELTDKASLKEAWSGSHDDPFSISTLMIISPERLKRESPILYTGRRIHEVLDLG